MSAARSARPGLARTVSVGSALSRDQLLRAVQAGDLDRVQHLIEFVDMPVADAAYDWALREGTHEMITLLRQHYAPSEPASQRPPQHAAAATEVAELGRALLATAFSVSTAAEGTAEVSRTRASSGVASASAGSGRARGSSDALPTTEEEEDADEELDQALEDEFNMYQEGDRFFAESEWHYISAQAPPVDLDD